MFYIDQDLENLKVKIKRSENFGLIIAIWWLKWSPSKGLQMFDAFQGHQINQDFSALEKWRQKRKIFSKIKSKKDHFLTNYWWFLIKTKIGGRDCSRKHFEIFCPIHQLGQNKSFQICPIKIKGGKTRYDLGSKITVSVFELEFE